MNHESPPTPNDVIQRGHEPDQISARLVIATALGLVLLVAMVLLLMYGTIKFLTSRNQPPPPDSAITDSDLSPSGPQVSTHQPDQLARLRLAEEKLLTGYEWVDEQAGIARIPIDRAKELIANGGFPSTKQNAEQNTPPEKQTERD